MALTLERTRTYAKDNGKRISFLHVFLFSSGGKLFPLLYIIERFHLRVEMSFRNNDKGKGYNVFLDYLLYLVVVPVARAFPALFRNSKLRVGHPRAFVFAITIRRPANFIP